MSEENKALYSSFVEEVFNGKNVAVVDKYIAPDSVDHNAPPGVPQGLEGAKQGIAMYFAAFPDFQATIEDLVAEGDKVVARYTVRGTHRGEFMGVAPMGRQVTFTGFDMVRIAGGKIVEHWESFDMLGLMQQLGAASPPG